MKGIKKAIIASLLIIISMVIYFNLTYIKKLDYLKTYSPSSSSSSLSLSESSSSSTSQKVDCWPSEYDSDGDGYAEFGALGSRRVTFESTKICPSGYVEKRGDCDDEDPSVHPRRDEVSKDGVDNNCSRKVDEPRPIYLEEGNFNTPVSFRIKLKINLNDTISSIDNLYYQITYQSLENTELDALKTRKRKVTRYVTLAGGDVYVEVALKRLEPSTVYRAKVQFYKSKIVKKRRRFIASGEVSPWYYTTTDSYSEMGKVRTKILLKGFYYYYKSSLGEFGYLADGWSDVTGCSVVYDGAGTAWCSEFYSFVVGTEFDLLSGNTSVREITDDFREVGSFIDNSEDFPPYDDDFRGDYLAIKGFKHSAMVLDYDVGLGKYWTLEGNVDGRAYNETSSEKLKGGDEVYIYNHRVPSSSSITGWGSLRLFSEDPSSGHDSDLFLRDDFIFHDVRDFSF